MTLPRWTAIPTALSLALVAPLAPAAGAAQPTRPDPSGFTIPLEAGAPGQGTFTGTLRLLAFRVENNQLVAVGLVSGSRLDEAGAMSSIVRTVKVPTSASAPPTPPPAPGPPPSPEPPVPEDAAAAASADEPPAEPPTAPPAGATCQPLRLELGPLEMDVLGTAVRVDRILLEVDPVTRASVSVLCGPAGSGETPREQARKLNRLVAALT